MHSSLPLCPPGQEEAERRQAQHAVSVSLTNTCNRNGHEFEARIHEVEFVYGRKQDIQEEQLFYIQLVTSLMIRRSVRMQMYQHQPRAPVRGAKESAIPASLCLNIMRKI